MPCASASQGGESLDDVVYECFALVREAAKRSMGMRHFDVQMIGGWCFTTAASPR